MAPCVCRSTPDVTLTLSENDRVVGLAGGNQDGWDLIEGYDYHGKDRDTATDELVDRAIEMGYLSDGDTISVTVSSEDTRWQSRKRRRRSPNTWKASMDRPSSFPWAPKETVLEEDVEVTIPVSPCSHRWGLRLPRLRLWNRSLWRNHPGDHSPSAHLQRNHGRLPLRFQRKLQL